MHLGALVKRSYTQSVGEATECRLERSQNRAQSDVGPA